MEMCSVRLHALGHKSMVPRRGGRRCGSVKGQVVAEVASPARRRAPGGRVCATAFCRSAERTPEAPTERRGKTQPQAGRHTCVVIAGVTIPLPVAGWSWVVWICSPPFKAGGRSIQGARCQLATSSRPPVVGRQL